MTLSLLTPQRTAIAVLALMALAFTAASTPAAENRDAVAVIIGNKAYVGDTPEVDNAHNDADAMKRYVIDVLGYREGNIIDLRDATLGQLQDVFGTDANPRGRLFDFVRPGESDVTVFYSGHGVPGLNDRRGYLLPIDGNPSKAENTAYSFDVLQANLAKLPARSVQVFLDACFSGNSAGGMLIAGTSAIGISPVLAEASSGFVMLTAAQGDQVASWDRGAQHGLFTKHLLAALNGDADTERYGDGDGTVSLAEVEKYLEREMTFDARRQWGRTQTADVVGDRSVVLAVLPPSAPEPAYAIDEMDETLETLRNANVRAEPASESARLTTLPSGTKVNVTGKVEGRDWYRVALAGGGAGFIWEPLLGQAEPQVAAVPPPREPQEAVQPERPPAKTIWQVVLNEGITLGDWVLLAEDRLAARDFVALVVEAGRHARQHGDFPEVREVLYAAVIGDVRRRQGLDKVRRGAAHRERFGVVPGLNGEIDSAVAGLIEGLRITDSASARAALTEIAALKRIVGEIVRRDTGEGYRGMLERLAQESGIETPTAEDLARLDRKRKGKKLSNLELMEKEAKALHVFGDYAAAQSAYAAWLGLAPPDHPRRKQMAAALLKARAGERLGPREEEVEPEPISFFDLKDAVAAPVIRQGKVARYVTLSARFELEGEGALEKALEKARELAPRLRDDIVRRLNKTPVPLLEDSRDLDPDRLRELFLASGRRVLGREIVKDVLVEPARASQPAAPEPAPAPRREGGGH